MPVPLTRPMALPVAVLMAVLMPVAVLVTVTTVAVSGETQAHDRLQSCTMQQSRRYARELQDATMRGVRVPAHDAEELHRLLLDLVRSIGLLHVVDAGPAGQVSLSEVFALHELDHRDGLTQQDLATALGLEKSTVSRLVAGLEGRGLVQRERDPDNRRFLRLSLTGEGRRLHATVGHLMHARQSDVLAGMTGAERRALATGLTGLLRALHAPR